MQPSSPIDASRRALLGAGALLALGAAGALAQAEPRVINVVAKKFEFVPDKIDVKLGETVRLNFTAPEVAMGFYLSSYALRADIMPGRIASLTFTADKAGRFGFHCDVFCGSGHEEMDGVLVVA